MESKYYTPTIEEFHIGFEFEYKSKNDDWDKIDYNNWMHPREDKYLKHCTESELLRSFNFIDQCIKRNELKVKYLDKEDIKSLGWEFIGKSIDIWFKKEGHFDLGWNAHKIIMHYGLHDNKLHIYADDPGLNNYELFRGTIKNKSELKRLMQQLSIK